MILKKQNKVEEAEAIYKNILIPFYVKSEKFKQRVTVFSVILRSQNVNLSEKIDKYSEKFLNLMQTILINELFKHRQPTNNGRPHPIPNPNLPVCRSKHLEILKKLELEEDDSALSGMEDELLKSCQKIESDELKKNIFHISKDSSKKAEFSQKKNEIQTNSTSVAILEHQTQSNYDQNKSELRQFEMFAEESQTSNKIFQPLVNIFSSSNCNTCPESRKVSQSEMDVDDFYENKTSPCSTTEVIIPKKNDEFKLPLAKMVPVNYLIEPNSNFNVYQRTFIPKIQKSKEKLKNIIPFLKDFNPKFLKKENIDKKILRRFRNYVKDIYKLDSKSMDLLEKDFWKNFSYKNLLPPMRYVDGKKIIEFKSFNTQFMLWLFSKNGSAQLYTEFSQKHGEDLLQNFIYSYNLTNSDEVEIIDKLRQYIFSIQDYYTIHPCKSDSITDTNFSIIESYTPLTFKPHSDELLSYYLGSDINETSNHTFNLNNFDASFRRCGKKFSEQYPDGDEYNSYYENYNNIDSALNISMDSIQSVE